MSASPITTETFGDVLVVHAPSELTAETERGFRDGVCGAVRRDTQAVVVEFTQTERFDSAGLESLLDLQERLSDDGQTLRLCGLTDLGRKIFEITRLDHQLDVCDSVIDAVNSSR